MAWHWLRPRALSSMSEGQAYGEQDGRIACKGMVEDLMPLLRSYFALDHKGTSLSIEAVTMREPLASRRANPKETYWHRFRQTPAGFEILPGAAGLVDDRPAKYKHYTRKNHCADAHSGILPDCTSS
jgi:hypothetical protein